MNKNSTFSVPLDKPLNLAKYDITQVFEEPAFNNKSSLFWNGTIQNLHATENEGFLLTGNGVVTKHPYNKNGENAGVELHYNNKKYRLPYNFLLTNNIDVPTKEAGVITSCMTYKGKIYTTYYSTLKNVLTIDKEDYDYQEKIIIVANRYKLTEETELLLTTLNHNKENNTTDIQCYRCSDLSNPILTYNVKEILGDILYTTETKDLIIIGVDNIDKRRAISLVFDKKNLSTPIKEMKYFGLVDNKGYIFGEPIPNPEHIQLKPQSLKNGCLCWKTKDEQYDLICGYKPKKEGSLEYEPIVIQTIFPDFICSVNMSENDTRKIAEGGTAEGYPFKEWFISNFADSRGLYYDYGNGWAKCYVRIIKKNERVISDCYIYTYGRKHETFTKESLIAKGINNPRLEYKEGKLNQKVYHVGSVNRDEYSMLNTIPFTVRLFEPFDDKNESLNIQVNGLTEQSISYNKTLLLTGLSSNESYKSPERITTDYNKKHLWVYTSEKLLEVKKTSDWNLFIIKKVYDYHFATNILDYDNLIIEKENSIFLEHAFIPYNMEYELKINHLKLNMPSPEVLDSNNVWMQATAFNSGLKSKASSLLMKEIQVRLWVDGGQLSQLTVEAIDERKSILKPIILNLFDNYEELEDYFTIASSGNALKYKRTLVIKPNNTFVEENIYGKDSYNINFKNVTWQWSNMVYFPVGIGNNIYGYNYVNPTCILTNGAACRLLKVSNDIYLMYDFIRQIAKGKALFTITGQNYFCDENAVYYAGQDNNYDLEQFSLYTNGLKYLSCSGNEAYFYSPFEKKLLVFTGSNTLENADKLSNTYEVINAEYSPRDRAMFMLLSNGDLIVRTETDIAKFDEGLPLDITFNTTARGLAIIDGYKHKYYSLYNVDYENKLLPFDLETEYYGTLESMVRFPTIDIVLFKLSENPTITVEVNTQKGIDTNTEVYTFNIKATDWKSNMYRLRINPRNNTANGLAVRIKSNELIAVQGIIYSIMQTNDNRGSNKSNRPLGLM